LFLNTKNFQTKRIRLAQFLLQFYITIFSEAKMKKNIILYLMLSGFFVFSSVQFAQDSSSAQNQNKIKMQNAERNQHGNNFVDANGDGYNDNAPDHDGDGIPNGLDEDYNGKGKKGFVDLDGDGINDNAGNNRNSKRYGNNNANKRAVNAQNGNINGAGNNIDNSGSGNSGKVRKGGNGKGN
jgi:hypothetical protein